MLYLLVHTLYLYVNWFNFHHSGYWYQLIWNTNQVNRWQIQTFFLRFSYSGKLSLHLLLSLYVPPPVTSLFMSWIPSPFLWSLSFKTINSLASGSSFAVNYLLHGKSFFYNLSKRADPSDDATYLFLKYSQFSANISVIWDFRTRLASSCSE
jgi:hypothetical protein